MLLCLLVLAGAACSGPDPEVVVPESPHQFNVGFTIYDFAYVSPEGEEEILATAVWYPTVEEVTSYTYNNGLTGIVALNAVPDTENGPYPLIIFNHGFNASGMQYLSVTECIAGEGFIVAAPDFKDGFGLGFFNQTVLTSAEGDEEDAEPRSILETVDDFFRDTYLSYLEYRLKEAGFVVDQMLELNRDSGSPFYNLINEDAIGMSGHSLGGLAILGLIGAHSDESMKDERIKAALLLSSPAYPFEDNISRIDIPIMVMHGDYDLLLMRPEVEWWATYDRANPPKFYLVIKGANHFTFSNTTCQSSDSRVRVINEYALAFFNRYLKQDLGAEEKLQEPDDMLMIYEREF